MRGVTPSASRHSGHELAEKPSAWLISCSAVASCSGQSAGAAERRAGQKFMRPKVGRSCWSRTSVAAYAMVPGEAVHEVVAAAVTKMTKSAPAMPAPAGVVVQFAGDVAQVV